MKRIVLECKGRLANQLLCWANAAHVLNELGIHDRMIVINYPELKEAVFPGNTTVEAVNADGLPKVTRNQIASQNADCVWAWEDVFSAFPDEAVISQILKKMEFRFQTEVSWEKLEHIGLHVRYGDYVKEGGPFVRASSQYFLNAIKICRTLDPSCTFYLASDGTDEELTFLTNLPAVFRGSRERPLYDLYRLSKCRLIIGSNSTFSTVASYYGDVPLIVP